MTVSESLLIDIHMHLYPERRDGESQKREYEISEYGPKDDVVFSAYGGDVSDGLEAIDRAGFSYAAVLNVFSPDGVRTAPLQPRPGLAEELVEYNRWLCRTASEHESLLAFIGIDPWVMSAEASASHVREMAGRWGARGVKLHPTVQGFHPKDERMWPSYRACVELGIPILTHTGKDRRGDGFSEPVAFTSVLDAFPDLKLIMAHLGGAAWSQVESLARQYPQVYFDLCEIIDWTGARLAPSRAELSGLIRAIGTDRVMFGTDFPWYDLDRTVERVYDLPGLTEEEVRGILGLNAARLLGLPHQ